jgi:hypothetical protein
VLNLGEKSYKRILYFTDKLGVSEGYSKVFNHLLAKSSIRRAQVVLTSIYGVVDNALIKKGNRLSPGFNPDRIEQITAAVNQRVTSHNPDLIVCSCPAVLGLLTGWDWGVATIDKCRGGVYQINGIPTIVVLPISAIHSHFDERSLKDEEGEDIKSEAYRVKNGSWILHRDWKKVGRYAHGKQLQLPVFEYSIVRSIDDAIGARDWLSACAIISVDIETGCFPAQITCVGFTGLQLDGTCRSFVFPFYDPFSQGIPGCFWDDASDHVMVWHLMEQVLANDSIKTMQNGFYDCSYFIKYRLVVNNYLVDSQYLWYSLYMELPKTLHFISSILMDDYTYWKDDIKGIDQDDASLGRMGMEKYWRYNALDCYYTLWDTMRLLIILQSKEQMQINFRDTWMRMASGLAMSMRGMNADHDRRTYHRNKLIQQSSDAVNRFRHLIADPTFNINSPIQKADLFYRILGCKERTKKGRYVDPRKPKTKDNAVSAGKTPLKMIRTEHPYFRFLVNALEASMEPDKQLSNIFGRPDPETGFIKGGFRFYAKRFRTAYNAVGTTTTRFSSKESNFWDGGNAQNIREVFKDWLCADDGCILIDVDYSQSDDVFIGYEANDPDKIAVIESGRDGHAVHGELFFKVPYDEIVAGKKAGDPRIIDPVEGIRQNSKRIVHGSNFQMAALTLFMTMGREAVVACAILLGFADAESWSQERLVKVCDYLSRQYRKKYKRLNKSEWYREIANDLRTKGTITNAFGIERKFLGDPDDNGTQREATGFIGQSDTAGNMNRSMYEIDHGFMPERFRDGLNPDFHQQPLQMDWSSHGFMFLLQTHDSFTAQLNLRHPRWKEAAHNLLHVMNRPVIINGHTVRIKTEASFGQRWSKDSMTEWKGGDLSTLDRIVIPQL